MYQKTTRHLAVPLKRSYASFLESTPYAYTDESLDVSKVYIPFKRTCVSSVVVTVKRTYTTSIEIYNDKYPDIKNFEKYNPDS